MLSVLRNCLFVCRRFARPKNEGKGKRCRMNHGEYSGTNSAGLIAGGQQGKPF